MLDLLTPELVYYLVTFTDITSTVNLICVNKYYYNIITNDTRFHSFRLIYLIIRRNLIYADAYDMQNCVLFLRTNRYNYYKIAQTGILWSDNPIAFLTDFPEFYRDLAADKLITNPPIYNALYCMSYYYNRGMIETYYCLRIYNIQLSRLLHYYDNPTYTKPMFRGFINYLPKQTLMKFKNTEFAEHLMFRVSINHRAMPMNKVFLFCYNNLYCRIDTVSQLGKIRVQTKADNKVKQLISKYINNRQNSLVDLFYYLRRIFNFPADIALNFAEFIFEYMID